MPLTQLNLVVSLSWTLQDPTAFSPNKNGPASEQFTLSGISLTTWPQLYLEEIVIFAKFTITGDTHTNTTVDNVSPTDIAKLVVGQTLTGTGFATGTKVATISTTSFTTNIATTATNAGVTITAQTAPTGLSATPSSTGGTLTANTYYYRVTALGTQPGGSAETIGSNEVTAIIATATGSVVLTWTAVTGATSYKVYRGTSAGAENLLVGTVTSTNGIAAPAATYTDTGSTSSAASPPGAAPNNYDEFDISSFTNLLDEAVTTSAVLGVAVFPELSYSDSTATCVYSPGASNGLTWFLGGTTPTITIPIGGEFCFSGPASSTGQTVDATHKTLRITNNGGGTLSVIVGIICR